jgi:hypothetical protein
MNAVLTPIERCSEIAGLAPHEIVLGVSPGEKHERLLAKYRRARRSRAMARARIVADIRAAVSSGAAREAADLLIVLRRLMALDSAGPRRVAASTSRRRGVVARRRSASRLGGRPVEARAPDHPAATVLSLPLGPKVPAEPVV